MKECHLVECVGEYCEVHFQFQSSQLFSVKAISSKSMLSGSSLFSVTPCTVSVLNTGVMYSSSEGFVLSIIPFVTPDSGTSYNAGY